MQGSLPPDSSWTLRVLPVFSGSLTSQGQDILLSTTYTCVDTHSFSRHPYPCLFMEKAGKSFAKGIPERLKKRKENSYEGRELLCFPMSWCGAG